ncbi:18498_t:CDS:2, partial [Gigaspora margarita]
MSAVATKLIEKYNLTPKMNVSELGQYTSEFLKHLTDDRKRNQARRRLRDAIASPPKDLKEEIIREKAKRILQNRYRFSEDQVNALFSTQKNENKTRHKVPCSTVNIAISNQLSERMEEETIGDMAQRILRDKLNIRDVRAEAYALALLAKNANAGSSRLSRLRRELKSLGATPEIIKATKFPDITKEANEIQQNRRKFVEA